MTNIKAILKVYFLYQCWCYDKNKINGLKGGSSSFFLPTVFSNEPAFVDTLSLFKWQHHSQLLLFLVPGIWDMPAAVQHEIVVSVIGFSRAWFDMSLFFDPHSSLLLSVMEEMRLTWKHSSHLSRGIAYRTSFSCSWSQWKPSHVSAHSIFRIRHGLQTEQGNELEFEMSYALHLHLAKEAKYY